jgi:hypothetical protein
MKICPLPSFIFKLFFSNIFDDAIVCGNCGILMNDVGDSGDKKDSEDLFFDNAL